ncbi:MAG: hypothetical protein ACLFTI_00645 [Anaerolineales bacterium]
MNPFIAWLNQASAFASTPAAWGIFLTGAAIYLISEWRLRFLALVGQYFFVGIIFVRLFESRPEMALLKILVGWLVAGAFLLSARIREQTAIAKGIQFRWSSHVSFRILSLTTMTVVAYLGAQRYTLPFIPNDLALACYFLAALAILFIGTEEQEASVLGVGMLNLLTALDIFYSARDPGLLVTGLLVMLTLLVGLAISYLTVAEVFEPASRWEEKSSGGQK